MKPHTLQVIDIDDILDELFGDDVDSMNQLVDELAMASWSYGDTPYEIAVASSTLVDIDAFIEFLRDCVSNEIVGSLTNEQVNTIQALIPVDIYVNLEAR